VQEGLFTWPDENPRLLGSRCRDCETRVFPSQGSCPRCTGTDVEVVPLERRGTLWSWTIQGFPPKTPPYRGPADPSGFQPFGVGYVELPGQVRVEARLTVADPDQLRIGMEMELAIVPFAVDGEGRELLTFAFRPSS
jgi:uncharacterized OB-fold protein